MSASASGPVRACPGCFAIYEIGFAACALDGRALREYHDDPLIGRELDRYRIDALLGAGAMGRVYRAQHLRMSRQFALKIMYGNLAADPRMRARFTREAEAASRLNHPNLITVLDVGETAGGVPYLTMDLVEGDTLDHLLARRQPMAPDQVVDLSRGILRGLAHAHARGLVHRDLKPANVLLADDHGEPMARVVDFGLALVPEHIAGRVTTGSLVFGTPEYMAPEQATAEPDLDARADLFALGTLMYEMLAGVLPFMGGPLDIMKQNAQALAPAFAERVPGLRIEPALEALVLRMIEKDRDRRPASALEVLDALDGIVGGRLASRDRGATPPVGVPARPAVRDRALSQAALARDRALPDPLEPATTASMLAEATPRRWPLAVGALLIAAGVVLLVKSRDRGGAAAASRAIDAGAATTPAPLIAADAAPTPPPAADAAIAAPTATAPAPARARRREGRPAAPTPAPAATPTPAPARVEPRPVPTPVEPAPAAPPVAPAAPPVVTTDELVSRYKRLGRRLDALSKTRPEAAAALRQRYFAIPLADAMRRPAMRPEIVAALTAIERETAAAE